MKTFTTRAVAVSGAVAVVLGAGGCTKAEPAANTSSATSSATTSAGSAASTSSQSPAPSDILTRAKTAAAAATSGAFVGQIDQNGQTVKVDFKGTSDGKTVDVTIEAAGDGKARFIVVPDAVYVQADSTFWKKQGAPANVQQAAGKFIRVPASGASVAEKLSLENFLKDKLGSLKPELLSPVVVTEEIHGVPCWVLSGKNGKGQGPALYVSKDKFEILRFTGSSASPGQIDFSKWNEDLGIKAPAASEIMKIG